MDGRPLRLAHHGDWRRAPENTVAAFIAALDVPGCDGVELDVRGALDGTPVVVHDATLERVQGRSGVVAELSESALGAAGVPSLQEVLAVLPRHAFVDVELKAGGARAVIEILTAARGPDLQRAAVSSFDPELLEGVARLAPGWPRWLNALDLNDGTIRTAVELDCRAIAVLWRSIDPGSVRRAWERGLDVVAWTVRRRPTYRRLARLGVAAICVEASALDGDRPMDEEDGR